MTDEKKWTCEEEWGCPAVDPMHDDFVLLDHHKKQLMGIGHEWATFLRWQAVWSRAIALAWRDPAFKLALMDDPRRALECEFQFCVPRALSLVVVESTKGLHVEEQNYWKLHELDKTELKLFIPPKPQNDILQATAIADYGETGRAYPFSCF